MDNLCHTLVGVAIARAGLSRRHGPGTTLYLAVASNLPDVDVLLSLTHGAEAPMFRRTLTHSVFGLPLLALGLAALFPARLPRATFRARFGLALLAVAVHVFFDLVNSYGVVLFWPASDVRLELAWMFIIDLAVWALLLAPVVLHRWIAGRGRPAEPFYRASLLALAVYVGTCAAGHARAAVLLDRALAAGRAGRYVEFRYVFPEALGPHRWRAVARTGGTYRMWLVHLLGSRLEPAGEFPTGDGDPRVVRARSTRRGGLLDWFFKAPVWRVTDDGGVEVFDLRFRSQVLRRRGTPFLYRIPPGEEP